MATSPGFLEQRVYSSPPQVDDISVTDSDLGSSASHNDVERKNYIDYWFGKRYLECIVAETLLHATKSEDTCTEFDVRLNICLGNYPYAQCWSFLQSLGLGAGAAPLNPSDRACIESLLTVIGTTIRIGSAAEKKTMLSELRDMCDITDEPRDRSTRNDRPGPIAESEARSVQAEGPRPDSSVSNEHQDISRYSMALKENGDMVGVLPTYHILPTTSYPPGFKATVRFRGLVASGIGRTKKAAQHMAARDVCNSLHIDPWSWSLPVVSL